MSSQTFKQVAAGIMYITCAIGITVGAVNGTRETNHTVRNPKTEPKSGK